MNQYEAMFLFDPAFGSTFENWDSEVRRLMERANAEVVFAGQWDERRLAYKIKGRKRGVYVLIYFKAEADKIAGLERDAKLSENILRLLVLRADDMTPELMEQALTARESSEEDDDSHKNEEPRRRPFTRSRDETSDNAEEDDSDSERSKPTLAEPEPVGAEAASDDSSEEEPESGAV